jgi:NAD(P)-dependent dehydrogenase (short-subunit alcohol dehydrogenase family)
MSFIYLIGNMDFIQISKSYLYYGLSLVALYLARCYFNGPKNKFTKRMDGKVVVVTGSSEGIGKETAFQLLKNGATVIFACRDETKTKKVIDSIKDPKERNNAHFMKLDLSNFKSVTNFANEFLGKYKKLDILVNNAASVFKNHKKTENNIEQTLQVNTLSPMLLTSLLLDVLHSSNGRVINVSSKGYSRYVKDANYYNNYDITINNENKEYGGLIQYCYSKLGNIYYTQELDEYCRKNNLNILTASLHPGVINTELGRDYKTLFFIILFAPIYPIFWFFTKSVNMGSQTTLHLCYAEESEFKSGKYYSDCKAKELMEHASNKDNRKAFINLAGRYFDLNKEVSSLIKI